MIRFAYADQLSEHQYLAASMFTDRAEQFKIRLGWDVTVNEYGWECDEYDALNPLYIVWEDPSGRHAGSMRTLPTVGRTMTNDHAGFTFQVRHRGWRRMPRRVCGIRGTFEAWY